MCKTLDKPLKLSVVKGICKNDKRWYVKTNILGYLIYALVDSGATQSYMNASICKQLEHLCLSTYGIAEEKVQVANGEFTYVNEIVSLPMQIQSKVVHIPVGNLPCLTSYLLLGIDFMNEANMIIDTSDNTWYYKSKPSEKYKFLTGVEVHQ